MPALKEPISKEEQQFFEGLATTIWVRLPDQFGHTHLFPSAQFEPVDEPQIERVLRVIEEHQLPCVLESGPYGELSVAIFDHSAAVGVPPECLLRLSERHIPDLRSMTGHKHWADRFIWLSKLTHTHANMRLCQFYGLPEPLPDHRYQY